MAEELHIDKNGKKSITDIPEDASIMKAYSLAILWLLKILNLMNLLFIHLLLKLILKIPKQKLIILTLQGMTLTSIRYYQK